MTKILKRETGAVTLAKRNSVSCVLVNLLCAILLFVEKVQFMQPNNVTMATQSLVTDAQTYALLNVHRMSTKTHHSHVSSAQLMMNRALLVMLQHVRHVLRDSRCLMANVQNLLNKLKTNAQTKVCVSNECTGHG